MSVKESIGSVAELLPGYAFKSRDLGDVGIPVIKIGNISTDGRVLIDAEARLPSNLLTERHKKFRLNEGDIVLAMTGEGKLGRLHSIFTDYALVNQRVCRLRALNRENQSFLYYALKSVDYPGIFRQLAYGAAQPNISGGHLAEIRLPWPDLRTRRRIADILSAYDDLIENNNRRMALFEESIHLLYREWFVYLRFPGHERVKVVDGVPEGWSQVKLKQLIEVQSGFAFKSKNYDDYGQFGLVAIKNVQDGCFIKECTNSISNIPLKMKQHCRLYTGDILLSLTGNVGRVCFVVGENYLLNQRVAKLMPTHDVSAAFIYSMFRQSTFIQHLEAISTGVAQQNLSPIKMQELTVLNPPENLHKEFEEQANSMIELILSLNIQNNKLREARDHLLPRLMDGRIPV